MDERGVLRVIALFFFMKATPLMSSNKYVYTAIHAIDSLYSFSSVVVAFIITKGNFLCGV